MPLSFQSRPQVPYSIEGLHQNNEEINTPSTQERMIWQLQRDGTAAEPMLRDDSIREGEGSF